MTKPENIFKKICRLAGKAVLDYNMIREGDRVLVALSGGKDSMVLLKVLRHLQGAAPISFTLLGATFDPMFPGFSAGETKEFCEKEGLEHHTISFDMETLLREKGLTSSPCMLCSRMRRGNLYTLAQKLECNKIALGQHLDDICISFLMSLFRGNGLSTMGPNVPAKEHNVNVIRPLICVPEKWIMEYVNAVGLPERGECLYKEELRNSGDRAYFAALLKNLEKRIPEIRNNMLASLSNLEAPHLLDKKFLSLPEKGEQTGKQNLTFPPEGEQE